MTDRARIRVGRDVAYSPTDAEAATGNDDAGATWAAKITKVNSDGTANLFVFEGDGGTIALTDVVEGNSPGTFSLTGTGSNTP